MRDILVSPRASSEKSTPRSNRSKPSPRAPAAAVAFGHRVEAPPKKVAIKMAPRPSKEGQQRSDTLDEVMARYAAARSKMADAAKGQGSSGLLSTDSFSQGGGGFSTKELFFK